MTVRHLIVAAAAAAALGGCAAFDGETQGLGAPVRATLETPSVGTTGDDAADDPAIWASATPVMFGDRPIRGFVAGTDKKAGLYIYGLDGAVLQFLPEGRLNNVDLVDGVVINGRPQVVLGASDRTVGRAGVALYRFDPSAGAGSEVAVWGHIPTDVVEPYGFCMVRRGTEVHAILLGHEGELRQYRLAAGAGTEPVAREMRRAEVGSISEGCAADPESDSLYVGEEGVGVWRYRLDPSSGAARTLLQGVAADVLVADVEGLTILEDRDARYLIASSQGDSTFAVWRIDGQEPAFVGRFVVVEGAVDRVTGTDGLDALGGPVGDAFPEGLVVVQDDVNDRGTQNFKFIDWREIRAALSPDAAR